MITGAVVAWIFLCVVIPGVMYAFRREHRRRLIELGNLIQERLGAGAD